MTVAVIGWALVHSLWQGAAIAAVFAAFLGLTTRSAPAVRYWTGLLALTAMIALPIATAFRTVGSQWIPTVAESMSPQSTVLEADAFETTTATTSLSPDAAAPLLSSPQQSSNLLAKAQNVAEGFMPWMVALWFVGLMLSSLRLFGGLVRTRRLTRRGVASASAILEARVRALASKIDLTRTVRILESAGGTAPLVIGALRPVIVLPASLVTGLTPIQLDMLLAHELAHIRRHDFVINLAQTVIDTLLFYHPAAHWISKRVREERENCCDDIAIEVCGGNSKAYAATLLALEESRPEQYNLAAAATGGSLLKRVRRIVLGRPAHIELGPLWIAGLVTIAAALFTGREAVALGIHSSLLPGSTVEMPADTTEKKRDRRPDPSLGAPSNVLRAPAGGTLEERWRWAEQRGATLGGSYWIGYVVQGDPDGESFYYASDVPVHISNGSIQMSGSMRFTKIDTSDMMFSGVRLGPLVGNHDPSSMVMLFQVNQGVTGRRIVRTHVASFAIPAYFFGKPLIWLDRAPDAESIARIQAVSRIATRETQRNLVGAIGAHTSDNLVVPVLSSLALSATDEEVRQSAVESLGRETPSLAMPTLSRVARTDRSTDVRREAIEAMSHLEHPGATDSLMTFARNSVTGEERRAAVEALGNRTDGRATQFLVNLAEGNADSEIRQHAVEALGSMPEDLGVAHVERIARTAVSPDSRSAAVEAIGAWKDTERALRVLNEIVRTDNLEEVRMAAVEAISSVHDVRTIQNLRDIATRGETQAVQSAAVEALASTFDDVAAVAALRGLAERHPDDDVRITAMETLVDMKGTGDEYIVSIIRGNERDELRLRALEVYADHADHTRAIKLLKSVVQSDRRDDIRMRALELLGDMNNEGMNAVREFGRTSPSPLIRERAREILSDR